jgi:hypothetical protein
MILFGLLSLVVLVVSVVLLFICGVIYAFAAAGGGLLSCLTKASGGGFGLLYLIPAGIFGYALWQGLALAYSFYTTVFK